MTTTMNMKSLSLTPNRNHIKTVVGAAALVASLYPSLAEAGDRRSPIIEGSAEARVDAELDGRVRIRGAASERIGLGSERSHEVLLEGELGDCDCDEVEPELESAPVARVAAPPAYGVASPAPGAEPYGAPETYEAPARAPHRKGMQGARFGLGITGSTIDIDDGDFRGQGAGLLGRLHMNRKVQLEVQLSQDRFNGDARVDSRAGAALIYGIGRPGGLTPYLVVGAGINNVNLDGEDDPSKKKRDEALRQGYVEGGLGLEWEIIPQVALSADFRLQVRRLDSQDAAACDENAREGRISALYYF